MVCQLGSAPSYKPLLRDHVLGLRGYAGIAGNEAACCSAARMPSPLLTLWTGNQLIQHGYSFGLDTLRRHAFSQGELMHVSVVLDRPALVQAFAELLAADGREAGLHSPSSNAFWTAQDTTDQDRMRSLALQIKFNILATRYRVSL